MKINFCLDQVFLMLFCIAINVNIKNTLCIIELSTKSVSHVVGTFCGLVKIPSGSILVPHL